MRLDPWLRLCTLGALLVGLGTSCVHAPTRPRSVLPAPRPAPPAAAPPTAARPAEPTRAELAAPGDPLRLLPLSPALAPPPSPHNPFTNATSLYAVWAFADHLVYAVGERGAIVRWDGSRWNLEVSGTSANLHAIWGSDPQHIFAIGERGVLLTYDGKSWKAQQLAKIPLLWGLSGSNERNVWAVGDEGTILHWDGTNWTREVSGTEQPLFAVWAGGHGEVWAVGSHYTRVRRLGSGWEVIPTDGIEDSLFAAWGFDDGRLIAVGRDNTSTRWDGKTWEYNSCNSDYVDCEHYKGVYGSEPSRLWFVDSEGNIRGQGTIEKTEQPLYGIHGFRRQSIWAVGRSGRIWYYDGTRWTRTDPGPVDSVPADDAPASPK